jgi:hypothetical protein
MFSDMALATMAGRALGGTLGPGGRGTVRERMQPLTSLPDCRVTRIAGDLRELASLRDSAILTEEEFAEEKRRLLGH